MKRLGQFGGCTHVIGWSSMQNGQVASVISSGQGIVVDVVAVFPCDLRFFTVFYVLRKLCIIFLLIRKKMSVLSKIKICLLLLKTYFYPLKEQPP